MGEKYLKDFQDNDKTIPTVLTTSQKLSTGVDALNATSPNAISGYTMPGASWAAFAQAQYDYAKRYFVTATFRAEASSIFAPEHRVG